MSNNLVDKFLDLVKAEKETKEGEVAKTCSHVFYYALQPTGDRAYFECEVCGADVQKEYDKLLARVDKLQEALAKIAKHPAGSGLVATQMQETAYHALVEDSLAGESK